MKKQMPKYVSNVASVLAIAAMVAVGVAFAWWSAYNESRTYNRLTGAETTTWDAMWLELRVQDQPHKD